MACSSEYACFTEFDVNTQRPPAYLCDGMRLPHLHFTILSGNVSSPGDIFLGRFQEGVSSCLLFAFLSFKILNPVRSSNLP